MAFNPKEALNRIRHSKPTKPSISVNTNIPVLDNSSSFHEN